MTENIFFALRSLKKLLLASALICLFIIGKAQKTVDVLHYKFSIQVSDNNDIIHGQAEIKLKFIQSTSSFQIDLVSQNKLGKGMIIDSITSIGYAIKNYTDVNDKVNIIFSQKVPLNDSTVFTVYYHGIPADGLIISKNKYGERTFFADNWPNRAHNWIPCIDELSDKASFEFIVTAPSHYRVISNGTLTEQISLPDNNKLTHWSEPIPLPTKIMVIGLADFAVKLFADSSAGVPVSAWVYQRDSTTGFYDYGAAPAILTFLSNYIGPYPYEKLANVESKTIFGGMENAGAIFYSESSITGTRENESLLAHEITHQWFGDMVTEKNFANLWLSEGFATYFAHMYNESKFGADSLNSEMQKDRSDIIEFARFSDKPVVDSVSSYMHLLNINTYQKGSWILHMLRRQLGDSVFQQVIRTYYDTYKGKNADSRDFQNIAQKASGKKLDSFFHQWLYIAGLPKLNITWQYKVKEKRLIVKVHQLQKNAVFRFPLQIGFTTEDAKINNFNISKTIETFNIALKNKPTKLIIDPHTSLLFDGTVVELK